MITPYQLLQEAGFAQYTAMIRVRYNRDNTSLGAEKIAEMIRAIPGATRVSTVSLDKEHGIGIFNAKIISQKPAKEAYQALKQNALERYAGLVVGLDVGANTIEVKGDFILKENGFYNNRTPHLSLLREQLLMEVSIDELRRQWVESGKMEEDVFNQVVQASNNQSNYATWLVKKVASDIISTEDLHLWSEIFTFFDRYKQRFQKKDINQVKTREDCTEFMNDYNRVKDEIESKKAVGMNQKDKEKTDPCQLGKFKTSDGQKWTAYKTGPGQWAEERKIGSGTSWCTVASEHYFNLYMGPSYGNDKAYYIFINQDNPKEKYQIHYGSDQFKNKQDVEVDRTKDCFFEFYEYLKEKEGRPFPPRTQKAAEKRESRKTIAQGLDKMESVLPDLGGADVEGFGRIYRINHISNWKLEKLAKAIKETTNQSDADAVRIAEFLEDRSWNIGSVCVIPVGSGKHDILISCGYQNICSIMSSNFDTSLPICNEDNFKVYSEAAKIMGGSIDDNVIIRCDKSLPGKDKFLLKDSEGEKIYLFTPEDRVGGRAAKALLQLGINYVSSYESRSSIVVYKGPVTHQNEVSCYSSGNPIHGLNLNGWDNYIEYYNFFKYLIDKNIIGDRVTETNTYRRGKTCKELGSLDQLMTRIEKVDIEGLSNGISVGKSKDLPKVLKTNSDEKDFPVIFRTPNRVMIGVNGSIELWLPDSHIFNLYKISSQGQVREVGVPVEDISKFAQKFSLDLPGPVDKLLSRSRGIAESPNVLAVLRHNLDNNNLRMISLPYRRNNWRELSLGGRGVYGTWEQIGAAIKQSSPQYWSRINQMVQNHPNATVDAAIWFYRDSPRETWNSLVRIIEDGVVVAYAKRYGHGEGIQWELKEDLPENLRVSLNGREMPASNFSAPQPRQVRIPRQLRQNPQAAQQAAAAPEITPEVREQLNQYRRQSQNSPEVYVIPANQATEMLAALGFTNLQPGENRSVVVYRCYEHRGQTSHVALIYGNGQTIVAGYPQNPNIATAATDSQQWRRLTHQLDNSVRTFQQCHDICQELHIALPVAIQGWLVYRGQ